MRGMKVPRHTRTPLPKPLLIARAAFQTSITAVTAIGEANPQHKQPGSGELVKEDLMRQV
jgi:hypothetical protein